MIFRTGYLLWPSQDRLVARVEALGATLVDIRFSPRSRLTQWNGSSLRKRLGSRYVHIGALGNANHRGGPIRLLDAEAGIAELLAIPGDSVLLCACRSAATCHRTTVSALLADQGLATSELEATLPAPRARQLEIFTEEIP